MAQERASLAPRGVDEWALGPLRLYREAVFGQLLMRAGARASAWRHRRAREGEGITEGGRTEGGVVSSGRLLSLSIQRWARGRARRRARADGARSMRGRRTGGAPGPCAAVSVFGSTAFGASKLQLRGRSLDL